MSDKEKDTAELAKLQEENKKMAAELTKANEAQAKNAEIIKQLNEKLAEKEAENDSLSPYPVLTHKGKKYELIDQKSIARFNGTRVLITKESLAANAELLEHCIKKGFSCLRPKGGK